jgi:uracil-DNA glycosylase
MSEVTIDQLISSIADFHAPKIFNPWSESCRMELDKQYYLQRRLNLKAHLSCDNPFCILVGESPGYRGARFTGVPFTSESLLVDQSIPRVEHPKGQRITTRKLPWKEPSATIVWEELNKHQIANCVILFNAMPWHPEGKDGALSNRPPKEAEKNACLECLSLFFELFPGLPVLALGNTADESLNRLSIEHTKIRHPANGGAPLFRAGADVFIQKCNKRKEHNRTL